MLEKLRVVFTIPELRRKIFLTLFLLAVYRVGYQIPMPMVDGEVLQTQSQSTSANPLSTLVAKAAVFSGSNLSQATIFGLGIMPYITASIILQLLGTVWPPLMELKKEGEGELPAGYCRGDVVVSQIDFQSELGRVAKGDVGSIIGLGTQAEHLQVAFPGISSLNVNTSQIKKGF